MTDITIIGGGINGLLTAKQLLPTGCKITVLDKSSVGRESSWAGGGILLPLYPWRQAQAITDLVLDSLTRYPQLSSELYHATGIDPEWYDCGLLICKTPDIESAMNWCQKNHIDCQPADEDFFTQLHTETNNPLWLPGIAQARNPRLLKSLIAFLKQAGVRLLEHCEPIEVKYTNKRIDAVKMPQQTIKTEQLIITAGAWTANLLGNLFPNMPSTIDIKPVKGQMLLFEAHPDTLSHMILDEDRYLIPRRDGKILVGSTVETADAFDKQTTEQAKKNLLHFATTLFPALTHFPMIAHWAGIRPGTPEGVPYIGRHPQFDNLYINAGQFRNGLVMGPASAALLVDQILNQPTSVDPSPYQITS